MRKFYCGWTRGVQSVYTKFDRNEENISLKHGATLSFTVSP